MLKLTNTYEFLIKLWYLFPNMTISTVVSRIIFGKIDKTYYLMTNLFKRISLISFKKLSIVYSYLLLWFSMKQLIYKRKECLLSLYLFLKCNFSSYLNIKPRLVQKLLKESNINAITGFVLFD
jgi:hypothetical protein